MDNYRIKISGATVSDMDKAGTVIIMANSFNIEDDQGDISMKGSFAKSINESFGRWRYLFNHNMERKIGEPLEAWESNQGLMVKAVLNLNKDDGRNTYEDYKLAAEYGRSVEHSVKVAAVQSKGRSPRYVYEWKMQEFSYIPVWGSNPNTPLMALKGHDADFVEYCIKNGSHTDCYLQKLETLVRPQAAPKQADDDYQTYFETLKF